MLRKSGAAYISRVLKTALKSVKEKDAISVRRALLLLRAESVSMGDAARIEFDSLSNPSDQIAILEKITSYKRSELRPLEDLPHRLSIGRLFTLGTPKHILVMQECQPFRDGKFIFRERTFKLWDILNRKMLKQFQQ